MTVIDLTRKTFGRLTAQSPARTARGVSGWLCRCECGGTVTASTSSLRAGHSKSCGCLHAQMRHGKVGSRVHNIWSLMVGRCTNENSGSWEHYGGRGIEVCDRWKKFANFYADMGDPSDGASLERKDVNGHYCPENCKWLNSKLQTRNRRSNRPLTHEGVTMTVVEWSERTGIHKRTILSRLRLGWTAERALTTPVKSTGKYDREALNERRHISYAEKLAWALAQITRDGKPLIPVEVRKQGTKAVLRHVEWDHIVPVAMGGGSDFRNLQPLSKEDHKAKTKVDVKMIAKGKRLAKAQIAHKAVMDAKIGRGEMPTYTPRKSRAMAGSRTSNYKRKFNGQWERRT